MIKKIILILSFIAITISCLGILGLSIHSTQKRTKEIGIRKINGAKIWEVLALINIDYLLWVALAFIFASPVSWYFLNKWLETFAYKIKLEWWMFLTAGVIAFVIAILTVSWQSWKVAKRNPVEALRYE